MPSSRASAAPTFSSGTSSFTHFPAAGQRPQGGGLTWHVGQGLHRQLIVPADEARGVPVQGAEEPVGQRQIFLVCGRVESPPRGHVGEAAVGLDEQCQARRRCLGVEADPLHQLRAGRPGASVRQPLDTMDARSLEELLAEAVGIVLLPPLVRLPGDAGPTCRGRRRARRGVIPPPGAQGQAVRGRGDDIELALMAARPVLHPRLDTHLRARGPWKRRTGLMNSSSRVQAPKRGWVAGPCAICQPRQPRISSTQV